MIVSRKHNFIFVHVHKTAGESVTAALAARLGLLDVVVDNAPLRKLSSLLRPATRSFRKHSTAQDLRANLPNTVWEKSFKFTFVRDPVARLRSLYGYVGRQLEIRHRRSLRNASPAFSKASDPLNWPGTHIYLETSSFSDFTRHLEFQLRDPGMRPQWRAVCDEDGRPLVDFVGRFETLERDFATVLERIGLDPVPLPRRNASRSERIEISPEDAAHLHDLYRRDYEIFGYAPPASAAA